MSENKTPLPDDLETELKKYYSSPEPRPEFVARLERGLHSKLKEQEQKKMFGRFVKLKWGFGLAFAALVIGLLVTSPTVATAMKRLFSYVPGVGVVETSIPLRVLAEPVTQTRDGVTVTVTEAVAGVDKTVLIFTIDNIPFADLSHQEDQPGCGMTADLRLPDGTSLQLTSGQGEGWGSGYRNHFIYSPIPADVNEATLFIPCIQGVLPGVLPENWELPLRFIPAPDDMTTLPVVESTPVVGGQDDGVQNPITLNQIIDLDDAYILIGEFSPPVPADLKASAAPQNSISLTDANGQELAWEYPQDIELPDPSSHGPFVTVWAVKVAKGFAPPLNIKISSQYSYPASAVTQLEFDAGENPQAGDVWDLNTQFTVDGHVITLINADAIIGPACNPIRGYGFTFNSTDTAISNVSVVGIEGYEIAPMGSGNCNNGGGGGGGMDAGMGSTWGMSMGFTEMPKGKLKVNVAVEFYSEPQEWKLEWQPETQPVNPNPAPSADTSRACLTSNTWQSAVQSSAPIPTELTGRVISYGRIVEDGLNPSPENFGVLTNSLNGSKKQVIGPGVWPSLSPDGTQAVYAWDDGLYLANLASGEKHHIPNTNASDYGARWSPDGKQIAFIRIDDFNLYVIRPDGSALTRVTSGIGYEQLVDWSPDGTTLFYGLDSQAGMMLAKVDIASGLTSNLFAVESKGATFDISPDGTRVAFSEQSGMSSIMYTSNLNGSDRRIIAQLENSAAVDSTWSPDGKWLIVKILSFGTEETALALVNVQDCRIAPLSWTAEQLSDWVP